MPTIGRTGPYRFFLYTHDLGEPPHVHVDREGMSAKVRLLPVNVARSRGYKTIELARIERLESEHAGSFLEAWHEYFATKGR